MLKYEYFIKHLNKMQEWHVVVSHLEDGTLNVVPELDDQTELCKMFFEQGSDKGGGVQFFAHEEYHESNFKENDYARVILQSGQSMTIQISNHNFSRFYYNLFKDSKLKKMNIFEMGIGVDAAKAYNRSGGSLRTWAKFFSNSNIYGADIDKNTVLQNKEKRIQTFVCDQTNNQQTISMFQNIDKKFDLIIDDGLHCPEGNYSFFVSAYPFLKQGGVYIIEDLSLKEKHLKDKHYENLHKIRNGFDPSFSDILSVKHDNGTDNNLLVLYK